MNYDYFCANHASTRTTMVRPRPLGAQNGTASWSRVRKRGRMADPKKQTVTTMIDTRFIDDTVKRISEAMPSGARRIQEDVEKNVRAVLGSALSRLDLVNREEFEIQKGVLARSREKIEALERRLAELEAMLKEQSPSKEGDAAKK